MASTRVAQQTQVVIQETAAWQATATYVADPGARECYECVPDDSCASGYKTLCFIYPQGKIGGYRLVDAMYCQPASECEPAAQPGEGECVPGQMTAQTDLGPITFDRCEGMEWAWDLWVVARIPPHIVQVDPFPHWMVAMGAPLPAPYESGQPGTLTLQDYPALSNAAGVCEPGWDGEGCWSATVSFPDVDWNETDEKPPPGAIRDYHIGLRWRRIDLLPSEQDPGGAPPICWDWDEREWNIGQDYGYGLISNVSCGKSVSHIYETSSWGKPRNGPNFILPQDACPTWDDFCYRDDLSPSLERQCHCCEQVPMDMDDWRRSGYPYDEDLGPWQNPAYQVKVPTYWAIEWADEWYAWEEVGACDAETCGCRVCEDPSGCQDRCDCRGPSGDVCTGASEFCGCEPEYGWVRHFEGWNVIDLRAYGKATWYATSYSVITTGAFAQGMGCAYEFRDPNPGTSVRVPVIEVQSVLRDGCLADGTCPPGYPR